MSRESKAALRDASIDELSLELRERGWRIVPIEVMGVLASGIATGYWPSIDKAKDGQ